MSFPNFDLIFIDFTREHIVFIKRAIRMTNTNASTITVKLITPNMISNID